MKKFLIALLMVCTMMSFGTCINSNAAGIDSRAVNVDKVTTSLSINNSTGQAKITYKLYLKGNSPYSINATIKLLKRTGNTWTTVKTWTESRNSNSLAIENRPYSLSEHGTYMVSVSAATRCGANYEVYNTDSAAKTY